ncbi:MAG: hypothetical protein F9K29_04360 [Hyphomicrobiaceae bacterium]|nr:MAG: hypothetical protein F9K29_04360 [Hyphomicrobiaceae bacterium]
MRTIFHATSDAATALLNSGSIGVAIGAGAAVYFGKLLPGVVLGGLSFAAAGAGFGYLIWRTYRPRRPMFSARH